MDNETVDRELLVEPAGAARLRDRPGRLAARSACEVLPRFQPHLIFMDLAMPGIDGWETIRRIRRERLSRGAASPSSPPTPSTRASTTMPASPPRTSSPSRCASTNCSTGSAARWSSSGSSADAPARRRPAPRWYLPPAEHLRRAGRAGRASATCAASARQARRDRRARCRATREFVAPPARTGQAVPVRRHRSDPRRAACHESP